MSCIASCKEFIDGSEYACAETFSVDTKKWVPCEPCYQFNWAERVGNVLLGPMGWVLTPYIDEPPCCLTVVLIVAGVFPAIIALVGAIFKKVGELANPNVELRERARIKRAHIQTLEISLKQSEAGSAFSTPGFVRLCERLPEVYMQQSFVNKILKKKHNASHRELAESGLLQRGLLGDIMQGIHEARAQGTPAVESREEIRLLVDRWKKASAAAAAKIDSGQDFSSEEAELSTIMSEDAEALQKVTEYFEAARKQIAEEKRLAEIWSRIIQGVTEYNQIVGRMVFVE